MIFSEKRDYTPSPKSPISNYLVETKRHCNGGRTVDAGLWLKKFTKNGGKLFITMSGAGSSFEMGISLGKLIRAGKVAGISVTGANLEESLYRLFAHSQYAYIPEYEKLTGKQEKELDHAGLRRITDTFLPEDESVRILLEHFETAWRQTALEGKQLLWHEYFFKMFELMEADIICPDPDANLDDCWLYQAWKHGVEVFVFGPEDSTMGNIFAYYTKKGKHALLGKYQQEFPVPIEAVAPSFAYMHHLAEWYVDATQKRGLAFVQLGGGIAADGPICVVPHLKKDYLAEESISTQEKMIRPWAAFIEIFTSPMSVGSYSGASGYEKITWSKLEPGAFVRAIFGDYTSIFPDIVALILGL